MSVGNGMVARVAAPAPVVPAGMVHDVGNDLHQAQRAVSRLAVDNYPGEYRVVAQTTIVCSGLTLLEAMQDATAFVRQSPNATVHSINLAVILGPEEGEEEHRVTLLVSYPDRFGETTGTSHHEQA